jgi:hypothetical protein
MMNTYREFRKLRWNGDAHDETSLGAAYGSKYIFSDAMTCVPVKELEYNCTQ